MTKDQAVLYWRESAGHNVIVAKDNFRLGHYDWSLFFWHLTIEKMLKGLITQHNQTPPPIHDLTKLAHLTGLIFDKEQLEHLKEISTFNIEARYDDYKRSFYHKSTKEYAQKWGAICNTLYLWLEKQF